MFMMSFRLKRATLLVGGIVVVLGLVLGVGAWSRAFGGTVEVDSTTPVSEKNVKVQKVTGKTNEDRLDFIKSFGWEIEEEPSEIMEVIIPAEFDDVYDNYNAIQKKQGMDLKSLAGKRCKRYSYVVTNYPGTDQAVRVNLLVYKNKIVGGDVCSLDANGFIHGFNAPQ
ncbi:MAG: DUF4830 domain-containing protein [Oscillospiraceae bacterium]|jgi:hypothetical protein|nr:DUF4830 domain-containing protein [Oscillospiraceae bacterium]